MFKKLVNYDVEVLRKSRRFLLDGKLNYRKLFVIIVILCLMFLWIISKFYFVEKTKGWRKLKILICESITHGFN
jgi:hypothetical protein